MPRSRFKRLQRGHFCPRFDCESIQMERNVFGVLHHLHLHGEASGAVGSGYFFYADGEGLKKQKPRPLHCYSRGDVRPQKPRSSFTLIDSSPHFIQQFHSLRPIDSVGLFIGLNYFFFFFSSDNLIDFIYQQYKNLNGSPLVAVVFQVKC